MLRTPLRMTTLIKHIDLELRGPLNIQRAEDGENIFRQTKQNSARVVDPTRRDFVKYDGKDSADTSCDEFLEVPLTTYYGKGQRT